MYLNEKETIRKVWNIVTSIFIQKCQETLLTNTKPAIYKETRRVHAGKQRGLTRFRHRR